MEGKFIYTESEFEKVILAEHEKNYTAPNGYHWEVEE
jgi:hypothetical protein